MRWTVFLAAVFTLGVACDSDTADPIILSPTTSPYAVLDVVEIGPSSLELYVHYTNDAAVLGFAIADAAGARRYCPMYGSNYRGIPSVTIDLYTTETEEEVWVQSSWQGYESLAFYQVGSGTCHTRYGDNPLVNSPTPGSLGSGSSTIPTLDPSNTHRLMSLTHHPDR